ncbi:glycosyltransferase [Dickeya chrysanthemi]|uniref:glycosyltransferase n=1 Tax=Dickeya chrysanthemi TaxID=556 RepID=UPI000532E2B3|nr:glycosyltransferase [Dickeya chrysanthemi]
MKILQMTTYDIEQPDHGGKLRSHHLRRSLRSQFVVETLSFDWCDKEDISSLSIKLDQGRWAEFGISGMLSDWGICVFLDKVKSCYEKVCQLVKDFNPDLILLDQPFLWPLLKCFFNDGTLRKNVKIIYSSFNIEVAMKRKIYQDLYSPDIAEKYTNYVDDIEREVIKACDGAIAVSEVDANYITEISPGTPVRIYFNGHSRPVNGPEEKKWQSRFENRDANWVFVGSWHPPNINGLRDLVTSLAKQKGDKRFALWVLGSVGNGLIATTPGFDIKDYPWLNIVGPVSSEDIDSAILCSSGIVLPIWEGGGSNLKTAQALLSAKCILGAEFSFRAFEHVADEPGVFLVKDADSLAQLVADIRPEKYYARSKEIRALEWESILEDLPEFICQALDSK